MAGTAFLPWEEWLARILHPLAVAARRWLYQARRRKDLARSQGWREIEGTVHEVKWDSSNPREEVVYSYSTNHGYYSGSCWHWFDRADKRQVQVGNRVLLLELRSGTTSYYQQDGINSVTSLSNPTGALANTYTYDSFGKLTASTGTLTNPFRYTGREFDPETGIYEYRARYFDQNVGRFLSEDPLGFKAGVNFYRYVRNRPVSLSDPSGHYSLQGFNIQDAVTMDSAIIQLAAKLRNNPCCVDPRLRDKILNLLQPGGSGGVTFVYKETIVEDDGSTDCASAGHGGLSTLWMFATNEVEISKDVLNGAAGCPCGIAGTIMHELVHLTWKNLFAPPTEVESEPYAAAAACFGPHCAKPAGPGAP